jgi:hypothetical protein
MTTRSSSLCAALCVALAACSLALAAEPVYDAWAWLVWGRELAGLELDASTGPSWKPLPVAIAAALSAAGDLAPELWIVLVRAAWLLALVLAAQLAYRLAPSPHCGRRARATGAAFAALSLALLCDPVTTWARQAAAGMSEPLLVVLVLGAVGAGIAGRSRSALALGGLAALVRPEAWPLLAAYAVWRWRDEPSTRPLALALAIVVPALWLGPDLLASGDALTGAQRARRDTGGVLDTLVRAFALPLALAWPLALVAVAGRDRRLLVLAVGTLAWIAIVAAMVVAGFPGLSRFMVPAAALAGVLGGAGLARALARPRTVAPTLAALVLGVAVLTLAQLPGRVAQLPQAVQRTARTGTSHDRLRALTRTTGRDRLLRCGRLATTDVLVRTALAWELDVALSQVVSFGAPPSASGVFVVGPGARTGLRLDLRAHGELIGARGEWRVYSIGCPASAPSAGVSGARR